MGGKGERWRDREGEGEAGEEGEGEGEGEGEERRGRGGGGGRAQARPLCCLDWEGGIILFVGRRPVGKISDFHPKVFPQQSGPC